MSFITLCESESVNEDLLEHIIEEATVKFLIECVDQDQDDLIESLVYCVQSYYNEQEIDNTVFDYVFENFYTFLENESVIYETVLFESLSEEEKFDREVARREQNQNNTQPKKNIFKRALGAIGRGISKITPGFLKKSPSNITQEIKQNIPGKIGKIASAVSTAIKNPNQTIAKIKEYNSPQNKLVRTEQKLSKSMDDTIRTGMGSSFLDKQKYKFNKWNSSRLHNKYNKLKGI